MTGGYEFPMMRAKGIFESYSFPAVALKDMVQTAYDKRGALYA